jgi:outer membrane protein assembly factor BamB
MARRRRAALGATPDDQSRITAEALAMLRDAPVAELQRLRQFLTYLEVQAGRRTFGEAELARTDGFHLAPFPLPGAQTLAEFRRRLSELETPPGGFPEEELLFDPDLIADPAPPWNPAVALPDVFPLSDWKLPEALEAWVRSKDWWMYHHDRHHTGRASGGSPIRSTTVGSLGLVQAVPVKGSIITIPTIAAGKVYVGTSDVTGDPGIGGILYKIDVATGVVEHTLPIPQRFPAYSQGIGGSPAVVHHRVYVTALPGVVHCLHASDLTEIWSVDLRVPDATKNQPVTNPMGDCWSSPLVVGEHVYVGVGEGESAAWGFVYCLDARTGHVKWLFCTNKFSSPAHNKPNVIPASAVGLSPLPAGFTAAPDPPVAGVNVWSSLAYNAESHEIWMGTGNSTAGDVNPLPDEPYGSGILALDAHTGSFSHFIEPATSDCYRPDDNDADVCGSPTLFHHHDKTMVSIGTKAGAFFIIDAKTGVVHARRNVLPYVNNDPTKPLPAVDPHTGPGENYFGVFGTAAVDQERHRLYVCIGGYSGAIDAASTPFVRALHSDTLDDAWPGVFGVDGVWRYTVASPPLYSTPNECGLGSPALVNDVVFVPTTKPALYALDATTGLCLWSAPLSGPQFLGPAIAGKHVVACCGSTVSIFAI